MDLLGYNGQAKNYNKSLMDTTMYFIGKSQNQWDLHLQQIAGALRPSVGHITGIWLTGDFRAPDDLTVYKHPLDK